MTEQFKNNVKIKDLMCLRREFENRIDNEIENILRGRGRSNAEIKESFEWVLEERLGNTE